MEKIAIIGSRSYTNKRKIKEFIYGLTEKFGEDLEIVSGGAKDGADKYAKQFSLEFDINYSEFPPYHDPHNIHCVLEAFKYGKPYSVKNFFARNKQIAIHSEYVVAFIPRGVKSNGSISRKLVYKYCPFSCHW